MNRFLDVTADFAVGGQLRPEAMAIAAADGFHLIVNNRPDGESPDQPAGAEIEAAARAAGLDYVAVPVSGRPTAEQVERMSRALAASAGPALAFCRSGNRSILTWALGELMSGQMSRGEILTLTRRAGFDLTHALVG